jgi:hypothetical protein
MDEWIGIVNAAAPKYLKTVADETVRGDLNLAMLERRGLITLNYLGSHTTEFRLKWKKPPVESYGDGGIVQYERRDLHKVGKIDWRGYQATDFMTIKEKEMIGKGDYVIVNRYKDIIPNLTDAAREQIGLELYVDGGAAGNENRFCGMETFCATGSCAAGDIIATPSDTYFTLSTALSQGGTWSANLTTKPNATHAYDWPEGTGTSEWDYNSPKLANWSSTGWGTGSTSWEDNCERCLRRVAQWLAQTTGAKRKSFLATLSGDLMTGFKDHMSAKQRVLVPAKEAEDLGFPDTLNFEGVAIQSSYGVPANTGYIVNMDNVELAILGSELISSLPVTWDPNSFGWKFAIYTFGNFIFRPRHVAKVKNYA